MNEPGGLMSGGDMEKGRFVWWWYDATESIVTAETMGRRLIVIM